MTAVLGVVILVLASALWIWWHDGKTWQPFCGRIRRRIRLAIGVVSRDEMNVMQEHFQRREQQLESRMTKVEAATKFSNQLQFVSREIERRVTQLEHSADSSLSLDFPESILKPRSLVRLGVRVTLSDGLWAHVGTEHVDDIEDHRIDAMVQGPFCPVCLKRVVRRDENKKNG